MKLIKVSKTIRICDKHNIVIDAEWNYWNSTEDAEDYIQKHLIKEDYGVIIINTETYRR